MRIANHDGRAVLVLGGSAPNRVSTSRRHPAA